MSIVVPLAVGALLAGCGGSSDGAARPASASPRATATTSTPTSAATSALVGRWERTNRCDELVAALAAAGLEPLTRHAWADQTSANGESSFRPGSPEPTLARPCAGAIPRLHSHFFTDTGGFGSLDWEGSPVEDGQYEIVAADRVRIGEVTFRFTIAGDRLRLRPLLTAEMRREALQHPDEFSDAGWAVSVAYPGSSWQRVPCEGWC
jgi:hypothetical protein